MGLVTWVSEHGPQQRFNRVVSEIWALNEGTDSFSPKDYAEFLYGSAKVIAHEGFGFGQDMVFLGMAVGTRGSSLAGPTTILSVATGTGFFYDPGRIDPNSAIPFHGSIFGKSPRQDVTSATSAGQTPKTRGGTKSSRGAKSPQTLKPFWSNGKPKCRKGYRYDFKRKMCVKKS